MNWPVEGSVVSGFGERRGTWHAGIDIQADVGAAIFAAVPGTVSFSGWQRFYGYLIAIDHPSGFVTLYAHNLENLVEAGDEVEAGQLIAMVGKTGRASASHLHFEARRDGKAYNPVHVLASPSWTPVLTGDVPASSSELDAHE